MAENKNLRPLLKYPGGKERELNHINDALPSIIASNLQQTGQFVED